MAFSRAALVLAALLVVLAGFGACSRGSDETPAADQATKVPGEPLAETAIPTPGQPALWTATDDDTTVYLFGTVHILKPDTEWRTPALDAAFASADAVFFEADTTSPEAQQAAGPLVMQHGLYMDGRTLRDVLDAADEKEVEEAADLLGVPIASLDPMKPWMASINLAVLQMVRSGYDTESGVEVILAAEASENGQPLRYLETMEQQLMFFANMDEEDQIDSLVATSEAIEDDPDMLDELVLDWLQGDIEGIADIMTDIDVVGSQEAYDTLIVTRNRDWVNQIETLMQEETGVYFIAVGAGHLAGPDSVVTQLRANGISVSGP